MTLSSHERPARARQLAFLFLGVPLAVVTSGCGGGALSQAVVSDACRAGDPTCSRHGIDAPLALGATLTPRVELNLRGSAGAGFHLESAAPSVLSVEGGNIVGQAEGSSALLFVSDNGTALDFIHVYVKRANALELWVGLPGETLHPVDGAIGLVRGETLVVRAIPCADGQHLAGALDATWSTDGAPIRILANGDRAGRRIVAEGAGTTTLHVNVLDVTSSLQIVVDGAREGRS